MKLSVACEGKLVSGHFGHCEGFYTCEVVVGAQGNFIDAIEKYINESLKSTGFVCKGHEHEGHCNE